MGTRMLDAINVDAIRSTISAARGPRAEHYRQSYAELGACDLPGFLERHRGSDRRSIPSWDATPFRTETTRNIEFSSRSTSSPTNDPLRIQVRYPQTADRLRRICTRHSSRRVSFRRTDRVVRCRPRGDPIYRQADEIGALTVMAPGRGDELGWHLDNADFVVVPSCTASEAGGSFEYVPMLHARRRQLRGRGGAAGGDRGGIGADEPRTWHPGAVPRAPQPPSRHSGRRRQTPDQLRVGLLEQPGLAGLAQRASDLLRARVVPAM